jgi:hypothetical protein
MYCIATAEFIVVTNGNRTCNRYTQIKIMFFFNVRPHSLVDMYQLFGGTYCLHFQAKTTFQEVGKAADIGED